MYTRFLTLFLILAAVIGLGLFFGGKNEGFEDLRNTVSGNVIQKNGKVFVNGAYPDPENKLGSSSAIIGKGFADDATAKAYFQSIPKDQAPGTFMIGGPQLWKDKGVYKDNIFFIYWHGLDGNMYASTIEGWKL